ncbi:MAG: hypothetical protein KKG92_10410 [Gammaproteobacteria bacterium]|nr:hypothetical protein [Gammaproteobacteria bacterium]
MRIILECKRFSFGMFFAHYFAHRQPQAHRVSSVTARREALRNARQSNGQRDPSALMT